MTKTFIKTLIFLLSCIFLISGHGIYAFSYNYYATTECLIEPKRALYGGGIILNPDINHNLGWSVYGQGKVEERTSEKGNKFIVAHNRTHPLDSFSQKVQVQKGKIYSFSAWVQISEGSEIVAVVFKPTKGNTIRGGRVKAKSGCWSLLKGGMVANFTSPVEILFESKNTKVEIWMDDNVSFQPFTKKQWRSHQDQNINKVRRSRVRLQVTDTNRTPLEDAKVLIKQTKQDFPLGCGINHNILTSTDYLNWFAERFTATTFTNEMKWYSTEVKQGQENYTIADAMVELVQQKGISIRGHNVFWDDPKYQQSWVKSLSSEELRKATSERINSVVSRYRGKLIAWDVVNENLHFRYYEDKLGENASSEFYNTAQKLDPHTTMFLNEYNTIEYSDDEYANPTKYQEKVKEILSYPGNANLSLGIGLQGHFSSGQPNIAYMRSVLDILGSLGLPIWLTEVDVGKDPNQAEYLEEILREGYAHQAVEGIIMFAGPAIAGFNVTTLADRNFQNTPAGDVVDNLIQEWKIGTRETRTDGQGFIDMSLFHGEYDVIVEHPATNSSATVSFKVTKDKPQANVQVHIDT